MLVIFCSLLCHFKKKKKKLNLPETKSALSLCHDLQELEIKYLANMNLIDQF